jgi:hypothetical protein
MTLEQALSLMAKMRTEGGQHSQDVTDEHHSTSVSLHPPDRPDVTIEVSVIVRRPQKKSAA